VPSNADIAAVLVELTRLTELDEETAQSFRVRAYEGAVRAVEGLVGDVAAMTEKELIAVPGIGKSTASKIREFVDTGTIDKLERLRRDYPPGFRELLRVPGLGAKKAKALRAALGIEDIAGLREAIATQQIREVPGFGAKTEENLAAALQRLQQTGKEHRAPIGEALPLAERIVADLMGVPGVEAAQYAGSLRRFRDTIGDIDIVVAAVDHEKVMERFATHPAAARVIARGDTKSSIISGEGIQIDVRVVDASQYGAALLYFTGSKAHNVHLRQIALNRGWTLNEYGLTVLDGGELVAAASEEEIYRALGLPFIEPELREDAGELSGATLPDLLDPDDIRGDLHVHTDRSGDGESSLVAMVEAAAARGYSYLAVTDHAINVPPFGIGAEAFLAQREEIDALRDRFPQLRLLHGAELNINPDGALDFDDDFLAGFDCCVASIHSHLDLSASVQTERLLAAVRHPAVRVIGHPTTRQVAGRSPIEADWEAVFAAAAETSTALEINANPVRLDLPPALIRKAAELGAVFAVSTDAHSIGELGRMPFGVRNARRGWLERDRVVNTWEPDRFLEWARR
jgi:DNA polymerase (family 10)